MIGSRLRPRFRRGGGKAVIPVTLGLRTIYILPSGYGVLYLIVLLAMLIGSINYNNNLGFLLTFLLGSLGLTAMLHTYGMLYGLSIVAATGTPVFAGENMDVGIEIARVHRPRMGLNWYFDPRHPVGTHLLPEEPVRLRIPARTKARGWFTPPRLHIACEYPLGLFRAWARIDTRIRELVYPQPLAAPAPQTEIPANHGSGPVLPVVGSDDFMGLKAYQPGDPPQRIHWQSYSRGRGVFVKQFAGQAMAGVMLDMQQVRGEDVEKKLSVLCFHVCHAYHRRVNYGLRLTGQAILPGSGDVHRKRCLRALALFGRR